MANSVNEVMFSMTSFDSDSSLFLPFSIEINDVIKGIIEKVTKGVQSTVECAIFRVAIIVKYIVAVRVAKKAICLAVFCPYFTTRVLLFARLSHSLSGSSTVMIKNSP